VPIFLQKQRVEHALPCFGSVILDDAAPAAQHLAAGSLGRIDGPYGHASQSRQRSSTYPCSIAQQLLLGVGLLCRVRLPSFFGLAVCSTDHPLGRERIIRPTPSAGTLLTLRTSRRITSPSKLVG
jgi:hypothetical protein